MKHFYRLTVSMFVINYRFSIQVSSKLVDLLDPCTNFLKITTYNKTDPPDVERIFKIKISSFQLLRMGLVAHPKLSSFC